ncbi:MAG TPA: class A beta-lactamase [Caulobacteraceae bacterium]
MPRHSLSPLSAFVLAAGLALAPGLAFAQAPSSIDRLAADVAVMSRAGAGSAGTVGVAAWRLDGAGPRLLVHADEPFPMASTFKVAVAGAVLQRVQDGKLSLDKMISIDPDRMIDSEVLADRFIHPGVSLSVYNLLELMLTQSDNTATDYMVEQAGGPAGVTAWVRAQGVEGLRVDGGTDEIIRRFYHMGPGPFPQALEAKVKADPNVGAESLLPSAEFDKDPRDTTTPAQMAELLTRLFSGRTSLNPQSTKIETDIMARCRTGVNRLRAMMPPDTAMADKTGTIGGSVNDVGVITLPGGAGQVVVAVYIKGSDASEEVREKTIAQIGRAVRDYYLYAGR